jgi:PAS domain S-box-containing protein
MDIAIVSVTRNAHSQMKKRRLRDVDSPLFSTEDDFRFLFELSAVGAAQVSPEGRYLRVNQKFCQMLGYTAQELVQRTVGDITHPDDREASVVVLSSSFRGQPEEYSIEKRYVRKDGGIVWALVKWRVVCDEHGKPLHTVAVAEDITARKQAEEALRAREAQLRAIIDNSSALIFVKDVEGRYLKVNRWYELLSGMTEAEMKGKTDCDLYPKETADAFQKNDQEVIAANKPIQFDEQVAFPDGLHHFVAVKFPLSGDDGKPYAVCGIATDITDRKRTEVALQKSKERLQSALEASEVDIMMRKRAETALREKASLLDLTHDTVMVRDINDVITFWNRGAMEMYGWPSEEAVGQVSHHLLRTVFPKPLSDIKSEMFRSGRWDGELVHCHRNGPRLTVASRWTLQEDDEGRFIGILEINNDISKRKQAEEALRASEQLNQSVLNSLGANVAVLEKTGKIIAVNDAWKRFAKDNDGAAADSSVGIDYLEECRHSVERGDPEAVLALKGIQEVLGGMRADFQFEYPCHSPAEKRWFLMSVTPLLGAHGGVVVSHTNITERKKIEHALQAADERLKLAMEAGEIGIFDWNTRTNEVFWVEPSRALFGAPSGESHGIYHDWAKRLDPEDLAAVEKRVQNVFKNKQHDFREEYRLASDGAAQRWVRSQGHIFYDSQGEPVRMIGVSTDISDRKQAEAEREKLLAGEQAARADSEHAAERIRRLQAVTDSILGHFALKDLLVDTPARIRELLEVDSAVILLPTEDGRSLVVQAAAGFNGGAIGSSLPIGEGISGVIAARGAPLIVEDTSQWKVIPPILQERVRSVIGVPMFVEGRLVGVIHADSFTARRFNDSDLRLLQLAADRIALAIEQSRLYEVEQQARRQAEEANRMKDEFLAVVSHEMRSPLNAMLGYARLLRYGPVDEQKINRTVDVIERNGKAQIQLIEDLLDTGRIISGKLQLDVGPVDLVAVIESAVQTIFPAAAAKHIRIQTDLNPKVSQITGDGERLQQVIWNLLSNSVKFTPAGGRIDVRLERIDPHICVTVSDTGKGIRPDFLPYVFDRFRQADASSTRRHGGLGLGLALVKYLVELHGGTVEAFSGGESAGATFTVLLPVRAVSAPMQTEETPVSARAPHKKSLAGVRALVVDDEEDARELVKTVLAQYGADVVAASSTAEAFALVTTAPDDKRPDVIVTDLALPEEDGYSLLRRVRNWEREHGFYTPSIALSAYGRSEDRMRALMAGFQMHVAKPVEPSELSLVVASVLKGPGRS